MMWKDSYRLGLERIDSQHMELFRMTEELVQAVKQGATVEDCQKALGFLKDYVLYHFRDEEEYQASIGYSGMEAHKEEHRQFTQTVVDYERRLKDNGFAARTMKDLAGTVTAWLIYHVVDTDQRMVSGREERGGAALTGGYADLFSSSALEVMESMAGLDRGRVQLHSAVPSQSQGDIFVTIGLVGDVKGEAAFGFSKELALHLLEIMTGMELTEVDELVQSALCELTNISCGNAATALVKRGMVCDIRPPVVTTALPAGAPGTGVQIDTGSGCLSVALLTDGQL